MSANSVSMQRNSRSKLVWLADPSIAVISACANERACEGGLSQTNPIPTPISITGEIVVGIQALSTTCSDLQEHTDFSGDIDTSDRVCTTITVGSVEPHQP